MFHKKNVTPLPDYTLSVQFCEGVTKMYDLKTSFEKLPVFKLFISHPEQFYNVTVDVGGHGIIRIDELDLSCDELWDNGTKISMPFDGLMSFADATALWGLNESTLRKAISYGNLVEGIDVCKSGKQWVISADAMKRKYGNRMKN